jgi:hypothetical protein
VTTTTVVCPECGNDVSAEVSDDSEGDAGVIGGIHTFVAIEDIDRSLCDEGCPATDEHLRDLLGESYAEWEPDASDAPDFPY